MKHVHKDLRMSGATRFPGPDDIVSCFLSRKLEHDANCTKMYEGGIHGAVWF